MSEEKFIKDNPFRGTESKERPKPKAKVREEEAPAPEMVEETVVNDGMDALINKLSGEKKPESKAYSIYLDNDVVALADQIAKKSKSSRSKVINMALREKFNL